ncbi:HigA family addiction module antitoxin [Moraxella haemolytica]|uniref:HigA family addiction module antitoxin n=1 Tax=Moraxella TaxID=475 RepID=UPI002543F104|nr:HigA family addiction module antitoxin [Moraxella sp. ZY171148]WII96002.1 HigA family addiction module antitoxin [Moraxella sp. ZY171148]
MMKMHNPPHPGLLLKEYIATMTVTEMASRLGVTRANLSRILNGKQGISADMALRISHLLPNTTPSLWLNMQQAYDLWQAEHNAKIDYSNIKPLFAPQSAYV